MVEYFCPCREESSQLEHLNDSKCFYNLEYLYFCQECASPRCPKCVDAEPVCLYCPTCQYVVNADLAVKWGNACPRNCLECPQCTANTIVIAEPDEKYRVSCASCDFQYGGLEKRAFAGQVISKYKDRAEFMRLTAIYRGVKPTASSEISDEQLPALVKLHARFKKLCKACRTVLIDPDLKPGIGFNHKTMAWSHVPRFTVDDQVLRAMNPLPVDIKITLKSNQIRFASTTLELGPCTGSDEISILKEYPESLVVRHSPTSRQVYMSGVKIATDYGEKGPNWCSTRFSVEISEDPLVLTTIRYSANGKSNEINLWIRW